MYINIGDINIVSYVTIYVHYEGCKPDQLSF